MKVAEVVRLVQLRIRERAGEEDLQQARELVGCALGVEAAALPMHHGMDVTGEQLGLIGELTDRRAAGEPLQYIVGGWDFMGLPFLLEPCVLIPRPETEQLCERAIELVKSRGYTTALDLCCGSGCLGVALTALTGVAVTAADVDPDCLRVTRENAALNGADVTAVESDFFRGIDGSFDILVSNPPYLSDADMGRLQTELTYEPRLALYGGFDGLDAYRAIEKDWRAHCNPGGVLLLEIGAAQADGIHRLFPGAVILNDYAGHPRIAEVER